MKISTIIENMKKYHKGYGTIDEEKTRDKVLYGNVDQECTGIVTSCWASVDVIEYAIEKGANLIISHEALFWNHGDHQEWLEESKNSVYLEKRKLLDDHQIVVWRDHDYIHSGIPYKGDYIDGIFLGLAKKMGWEDKLIVNPINEFEPSLLCSTAYSFDHSIKAKDLAKELIDTCHLNGIKLIGNSNADIKKAAVLFHVFGDANEAIKNTDKSDVDCLLSMELIDFTYAEYLRDSGMLGRNRVSLGMGHFNLEEPGMEYMLEYLDEAIGEHIPAWLCRRYHRKGGCAGWQGRRPCLHRSGCCRSAHCRGWLHRQRTGTQRSGQRPVQGRDRCFRQHHCSHQRKGCCLHR